MLTIRQFEGEDSRSGSECSAEQDNVWRNLEEGGIHLVTPPPQLQLKKGGVWTRAPVPAGVRFGPFLGKWVLEPTNEDFAWEVLVPSAGIRGFLDASEFGSWLKFVRRSKEKQNLKHVLLAGQIFYQTIRDINPEEELCLGDRDPIQLDGGDQGRQEERLEDREEDETVEVEENGVKCLVCDKVFPDVYILDKHMVDSHRYDPDKYVCEHCSKGFAWRPNLLRHKMLHGEFRRFPCENCDKVFTDPSNLQRHIRTTHVGARCHACPECGKTFATSSGLKQHTHIHSSVKPFRCEVCFKSYTQFSNLCRHKRMHANCRMQIKCHKCGQAFSTVTSLSKHRRFCDSTPSPFMHGQPKLSPLDMAGQELMGHHGNGAGHFPPLPGNLSNKFGPGAPFFQPPFSSHIQNLFGPNNNPSFPFLHSPNLMFPTMLQRMALSQLNGKPMLSPNTVSSPEPAEVPAVMENKTSVITSTENKLFFNEKEENIKSNISDFRSIEEFRQRLINGSFSKNSEVNENKVVNSGVENSLQKVQIKEEVEDNTAVQETNQGFDVNRNKSDTEPEKLGKVKERPLDLRTPRKDEFIDNGPQSSAPANTRNDGEKVSTKECIERTESPREPEEPRGFQPVGAAKSFVPVTEVSLFPKSTSSTTDPGTQATFSPRLPPPQDSTLPFPRPVNPFLLGAMYRMQQPPYSSFHPSPTLPPIAPRPLPFTPPFMSPLHSSPFLPTSLPLLGRLGCYQDVLSGHHAKSKDRYACKFCGKVFPRSANLTRHLRTHTGEQPYKCKYCERSFSISSNLQRHVRNIHNKEKPFKCPLCERCFGQQTNLERHLKKHENCSDPSEIVDSPESVRNEDELGYFDEIRTFMGKVVDKNCSLDASETEVDVEDDDEDVLAEMD